ncbi:hypothetical protein EG827_14005 [bacterium]|nr:hypothetical protein [bacterium]
MTSSKTDKIIYNDEGMVLILVLIVLLAAIIIGTMSMSSATTEVRIARNEMEYKQDLCKAEGAVDLLIDNFTTVLGKVTPAPAEDVVTDITDLLQASDILTVGSSIVNDSDVTVSIVYEGQIEWPTSGTGNWRKNYKIISTAGNQVIEVGITQ